MPPMQWVHENWKGGGGQKSPQTAMMIDDHQLQKNEGANRRYDRLYR